VRIDHERTSRPEPGAEKVEKRPWKEIVT